MSASVTRTARPAPADRTADRTSADHLAGTVGTTRQQLDELDALLKRMLDLPVSPQQEENAEPEQPLPAPEPPMPSRRKVSQEPGRTSSLAGRSGFSYSDPARAQSRPAEGRNASARPGRTMPTSYLVVDTVPTNFTIPQPSFEAIHAQPPLNEGEPPAPAIPPESVMPTQEELDQRQEQLQKEPGDWVPLRSSWQPSAQTWKPLAESWEQSRTEPPQPTPAPAPQQHKRLTPTMDAPVGSGPSIVTRSIPENDPIPEAPIPPVPRPIVPPPLPTIPVSSAVDTQETVEESPGVLLWPVMAINLLFDMLVIPFGPLGAWLRTPIGRSMLGAIGLLGLGIAGAIAVAERIGWIR